MHKRLFIIPMGLLVISLMTPVRGFADDDDNARHDWHQDLDNARHDLHQDFDNARDDLHQDLRRGRQRLEKLRREGHEEIREHDRGDAHDDNSRALRRDENEHEHHDSD